jgi:secretion/DNA translocation related CpaE-like protein
MDPLLVTTDPTLADELARLAAAAGVALSALPPAAALSRWASAPVVLVGADCASALVALAPARRPGVFVAAWTEPPPGAFRDALLLGATQLVELPTGAARLAELLTDLDLTRTEAPLVGVLAGAGGAGATTLACALGQAASSRGPCLVVDLDPLGPGCDRVLGVDELPGVRWDTLGRASGRLSARSLRDAVPRSSAGPGVLTWPASTPSALDPVAVREALSAARRGHDLVVVDLPRELSPLVTETLARCTRILVLAPPTVTALASTARLLGALPDRAALPLSLLLRASPSSVDPFRVADLLDLPLLTTVPDQRGLAESLDLGLGPLPPARRRGPLLRAAREVLAALDTGLVDLTQAAA